MLTGAETGVSTLLHPCREQETANNHSLNLCVHCRHGRMGGSVIGIDEKQVSYGQSDGG
ncbi:hypothetical protein A343_2051 [Porphyromonas gingivalis JCVI SC001]|nr:hypothetical protein A343_2051 [Porphyromonas gingivalis JCVI SC001]